MGRLRTLLVTSLLACPLVPAASSAASCPDAAEQPFLPWLDPAFYGLAPGGHSRARPAGACVAAPPSWRATRASGCTRARITARCSCLGQLGHDGAVLRRRRAPNDPLLRAQRRLRAVAPRSGGAVPRRARRLPLAPDRRRRRRFEMAAQPSHSPPAQPRRARARPRSGRNGDGSAPLHADRVELGLADRRPLRRSVPGPLSPGTSGPMSSGPTGRLAPRPYDSPSAAGSSASVSIGVAPPAARSRPRVTSTACEQPAAWAPATS